MRFALLVLLASGCAQTIIGPIRSPARAVPGIRFSLRASDGTRLVGYFVPATPPARGTVLLLHGFTASAADFADRAAELARAGYHAVAWDARGHGESGGLCTHGARERHDVSELLDALDAAGLAPRPRLLFGFSMGGAVAIQAAADDRRIDGVMAVAPFSSLERVIRRVAKGAPRHALDRVIARAENRAGFRVAAVRPVDDVGRVRVPLVVVAGALDTLAPPAEVWDLAARSGGPAALLVVRGAGHDDLLARCGSRCDEELGRLLRQVEKRPTSF